MVSNGRLVPGLTTQAAGGVGPRREAVEVLAVVAMAPPALTPLTQLRTPVAAAAVPHTALDQEETAAPAL
jgi:hypothetical protein